MSRTALVVDDHPVTHLGCRRLLARLGYDPVLEAGDAAAACRQLERVKADLIVLDLGLPGIGGLQLIRLALDRAPAVRILVFSMTASPALAAQALAAGASGFLAKSASPEDFLVAVRRLEGGQIYLAPDFAIDVAAFSLRRGGEKAAALSPREHQILRLLGEGLGYKEIADAIHVSYKTVANACTAMKRKLQARSHSDLLRIAIQDRRDGMA